MKTMRCINNQGNEASLTIGVIYRSLPTTPLEDKTGMVRVIDNEGEDYLYPRRWFEIVSDLSITAVIPRSLTIDN